MEIAGRNALVTGAGKGIGEASALMLAEQGASAVVIADIDAQALADTAAAIDAAGARAISRVVDLSHPEAVAALLEEADAETGGLDIVHNNAGIMTGEPDFPDTVMEKMVAVIQINLIAMMVGTRKAIELMRARDAGGVIVNTASVAAFGPMPTDPAYSASKAGIVNFTQSCKPLHESLGIRVMAVCPAIVDTAIVPHDAEWLQPALQAVKMLRPSDIAAAVQGIIEDDSVAGDYVTVNNEPA
jgi:3-oxoacyl-[acyl-carrier protein] reductase